MDSTFPGKIADGTGHVEVDIYNTTVTLTGTENYSGGTYLYSSTTFMVTATLLLGNGTNNTMVTGEISVNDEGWITFYAGLVLRKRSPVILKRPLILILTPVIAIAL